MRGIPLNLQSRSGRDHVKLDIFAIVLLASYEAMNRFHPGTSLLNCWYPT